MSNVGLVRLPLIHRIWTRIGRKCTSTEIKPSNKNNPLTGQMGMSRDPQDVAFDNQRLAQFRRAGVNRTGMEWMLLIVVDGMRSTGPANSMFFIRDSTSGTRAAASARARFAPRQKWVPPPPKARWWFGLRPISNRSGSAKWVSSRLADG